MKNNHNSIKFNIMQNNLYKRFLDLDPSKKTSKSYKGVLIVLLDINNPDRFLQAACSIRNIFEQMIKTFYSDELYTDNLMNTNKEDLLNLNNCYDKCLNNLKVDDKNDKNEIKILADDLYKKLVNVLIRKNTKRRTQIESFFGENTKLKIIPSEIRKHTVEFYYIYDYFNGILHGGHIDEKEFNGKWLKTQDIFSFILSNFNEDASKIDEYLKLEL